MLYVCVCVSSTFCLCLFLFQFLENYFSVRKRAAKGTSTAKSTVKKLKVACVWTRLGARNPVVRVHVADVTRLPVRTRGKWRIGPNVRIRADLEFNIVESLVIESTHTNGLTRSPSRLDATPLKGRLTCRTAVLATVTFSTCGGRQLGNLARPPNVAAKAPRNDRWPASIAGQDPGSRDPIAHKNSGPSARDAAGLLHVSIRNSLISKRLSYFIQPFWLFKSGGYVSCKDVLMRSGGKDRKAPLPDGPYALIVAGKNITIYCHLMNTSSPLEYLTLTTGHQDNYAEVYDKT